MPFLLQALPYQIQVQVLSYLDPKSLRRTAAVSRYFRQIIRDNCNSLRRLEIINVQVRYKENPIGIFWEYKPPYPYFYWSYSPVYRHSFETVAGLIDYLCQFCVREIWLYEPDLALIQQLGQSPCLRQNIKVIMSSINEDIKLPDLKLFFDRMPLLTSFVFKKFAIHGLLVDLIKDMVHVKFIKLERGRGLTVNDDAFTAFPLRPMDGVLSQT